MKCKTEEVERFVFVTGRTENICIGVKSIERYRSERLKVDYDGSNRYFIISNQFMDRTCQTMIYDERCRRVADVKNQSGMVDVMKLLRDQTGPINKECRIRRQKHVYNHSRFSNQTNDQTIM